MTLLQKINNLTWWNEINKLKDILKSLLIYLDILDTKVKILQSAPSTSDLLKLDKSTYIGTAQTLADSKQDTLVSGTNIKTINGSSVLGSGDITISSSATIPVSATQSGIVNNVALQELGGVDKIINGVRIGRGGSTSSSTNTVVGNTALSNITASSLHNTAIGFRTLANNSGNYNTAIGGNSLTSNTTGGSNISLGFRALIGNTTGSNNIAIGENSLSTNVLGVNNIAIGTSVLSSGNGNNNTVIGNYTSSSLNITTGSGNTIIGTAPSQASNLTNNIILADGVGNIRFRVNDTGVVKIVTPPLVFTDNTTAIAGGLTAGDIYRTSLGVMMIVF